MNTTIERMVEGGRRSDETERIRQTDGFVAEDKIVARFKVRVMEVALAGCAEKEFPTILVLPEKSGNIRVDIQGYGFPVIETGTAEPFFGKIEP